MPRLIVMEHAGKTRQVELKPSGNRIGRGPANDVVLDTQQASRVHALITVELEMVTITDRGSHNGTFVNGARIDSQMLVNGDTIRIGTCEIRFLSSDREVSQVDALRLMTAPGQLVEIDRRSTHSGSGPLADPTGRTLPQR
ncbi:MAG: FHA domain-containing protein [Gammaproteobacteria bacterium]|nr:FHA domain-containing protein [Gammaproteobacteria bacterium]MBU1440919.1 FHA domain-containing protein [Gammaproteobacteria bacterium]MBU2286894.1 FHA domain-containing protein [Gammaproteobacteria bacterium]MBU2409245.1 FHA domain-containing protein [Gammaproteobacteria bacterium]